MYSNAITPFSPPTNVFASPKTTALSQPAKTFVKIPLLIITVVLPFILPEYPPPKTSVMLALVNSTLLDPLTLPEYPPPYK